MSVLDGEFNILEHWNIPKLLDEGEIRTQEPECTYSLESVSDKDSGVPTQPIAKHSDNYEDIRQDVMPPTKNEVTQKRSALKELNSSKTIAGSGNSVLFNVTPLQKKLRPLKCSNVNCQSRLILEQQIDHSPCKVKGVWCCEKHRIEARNTRERGKRERRKALAAQNAFEHYPFQRRKNRQWCCFNHQKQFRNERRRGNKQA